jgi:hypothetical protein
VGTHRETGEVGNPEGPEIQELPGPGSATDPEAAVVWATQNGILRGYPDGSLRLDEVISRAEMAVIVSRYLDLPR